MFFVRSALERKLVLRTFMNFMERFIYVLLAASLILNSALAEDGLPKNAEGADNPKAVSAVAEAGRGNAGNAAGAAKDASAQSAPERKLKGLSATVIPTRQDPSMDWWVRVPTPPSVIMASKGWLGDKICFYIFLTGITKSENEDYELKISVKAGKEGALKDLGEKTVKGKLASPAMVTIPPVSLEMIFEEGDEFGTYVMEVDVQNLKTGERVKSAGSCKYEKWTTPAPIDSKKAREIIFNFNSDFSPEKLYQCFMQEENTFKQKGPWYGINPATYSFYKHAFTKNKFLLPILRADFKKGTPRQRENIIMLFAFLGEKPFEIDALSPDEVVLQTQTRKIAEKIKDDPYKEIKQPGDLDLLWGEFFALGTYKPARRVVDALTGKSDRGFAEDVLNGKVKVDPKDDEAMRRLFQGLIPISAEWSILTNLRNKLFLAYMSWALKNDLPVESKAAFSNMLRRAKEGKIISPSGAKRAAKKAKSGGSGGAGADKATGPQPGEANPAGTK